MHFDGVSLHVCAKNHPLLMEGMWHLIFHWIPSYFGTSTFISSRFFSTPLIEQLDLAADVPVHCKRAGQDDLQRSFPTQMILWCCDIKGLFLSPLKMLWEQNTSVLSLKTNQPKQRKKKSWQLPNLSEYPVPAITAKCGSLVLDGWQERRKIVCVEMVNQMLLHDVL